MRGNTVPGDLIHLEFYSLQFDKIDLKKCEHIHKSINTVLYIRILR